MRRGTNYNKKNLYRFEFKSTGARNNALKLLERKWLRLRPGGGSERLRGPTPQISEICADLKNSVAFKEVVNEGYSDEGLSGGRGSYGLGCKNCSGEFAF